MGGWYFNGPFNWVRTNQKGDCPAKTMSLRTKIKRLLRWANVGFAAIMSNPGKILIVLDDFFYLVISPCISYLCSIHLGKITIWTIFLQPGWSAGRSPPFWGMTPQKTHSQSLFDGHIQEKPKIYRKIYPKIYIYIFIYCIYIYIYLFIPLYPCVLGVLHHFYMVIWNNDGWSMDIKGSYS